MEDNRDRSQEERLVNLHGEEYVEGRMPVHLTYDLAEIQQYAKDEAEADEHIRSKFSQMRDESIREVYDRANLTTEEWQPIATDIDKKLSVLHSFQGHTPTLDQATYLFTKYLVEAKTNQDFAKYEAVVGGIDLLHKELN